MRILALLLTLITTSLYADISISTKADKSSLALDSTLDVVISLSYPQEAAPDTSTFLSNVSAASNHSFQIVSSSVTANAIHFTLAPKHTGTLIFAPGIISFASSDYLVPPVAVVCEKIAPLHLPLAHLLPLYPEKRIDLSPQNRLALISKQLQELLKKQNESSYNRFSIAWNSLAYLAAIIAVSCLCIWAIIYYEVLEMAKRPKPAKESPLQKTIKSLQNPSLSQSDRWKALIELVRVALETKENRPFHQTGLYELADYVAASPTLSESDKKLLIPSIQTLAPISYAGKTAPETTYQELLTPLLTWAKGV